MPLPAPLADALQALHILILHELATDIGPGHERELFLQLGAALLQRALQYRLGFASGQALPVRKLGIAPEHLEAHAHFMDSVVQGLQLGRLVHHVLGAGDLAAIMQPGGNTELVALGLGHAEVGKGAAVGLHGLVQQHLRQLRHTLAVATGIGALGIDGVGQQLDHRVQQALLGFDQLARLDGHGSGAGQFFDEAAERLPYFSILALQFQDENAEQLMTPVIEHHRKAAPAQRQGLCDRSRQVKVIGLA